MIKTEKRGRREETFECPFFFFSLESRGVVVVAVAVAFDRRSFDFIIRSQESNQRIDYLSLRSRACIPCFIFGSQSGEREQKEAEEREREGGGSRREEERKNSSGGISR